MLDRIVSCFEKIIIASGLAAATLLLFTSVVLRYLFATGWPWVLELVQYLFAWVVLIGAAHGVKTGIHLGIDVLTSKFTPKLQRYIALFAISICLGFSLPVLYLSAEYTYRIWQWGDLSLDLQIPQWIPYLAIPIGLALMSYRFMQAGIKIWRGELLSVGRTEHSEVKSVEIVE